MPRKPKLNSNKIMSSAIHERIPFEEAITDSLLLKSTYEQLSRPQQSALRIFYGLPLDKGGLEDYNMFLERAIFDELGYVKEVEPATDYIPLEHDEAVIVFGRRSAKTSGFLAVILVYEALLGGHTLFAKPKQQIASFVVAQKLDIAQAIIRDFIEPIAASSKLLEKEIISHNTEGIIFRNGHKIIPAPPVIKNFRYYAIPVVGLDEAAFWYKDAESANPDYEVIRAIEPAQAQFPNRKQIIGSTVWSKEGIIWEARNAGIYGRKLSDDDERKERYRHTLVLVAPTPAMQNPLLQRQWFERQFKKDPEAYRREILNIATDAVSGLFSEALLRKAIEGAPSSREPDEKNDNFYIATIDPAFRGDDFAFVIGHYERERGYVQDLLRQWTPEKHIRLNPATILDEIKVDLDKFKIDTVYSDQYQLESLQQLASDRNMTIIGMDFTASSKSKIYGSFLQLSRNERVHLVRNNQLFQQFLWIQKIVGHGGYVRISAPPGKHDDLVTATVLNCAMAIKFEPSIGNDHEVKSTSIYDQVMAKLSKPHGEDNDGYL